MCDQFIIPSESSLRVLQREIDSIYEHLILDVDPSKVGFVHPPQTECDRIRKNICFETDQCEAQIAIACVSYLTSGDVLANLSRGLCKYQLLLKKRISENELLEYCSNHFDKHTQNVREPTIDILNVLNYFLSIDTKALAAILQIRSVNMDYYHLELESYCWQVDAMSIIYSTALFTLPHMRKSKWMKQQAYESLLHYAATGGLLGAIEHLILSGVSVKARNKNGVMGLYCASENGHYDICQLFLQNSVDINARGGRHGCALQAASWSGQENIVQLLLAKDADVNLTGGYYGSALQAASFNGHENIVQLLLAKDADIMVALSKRHTLG